MSEQSWEDRCLKCGRCCYSLIEDSEGNIHRNDVVHCRAYDLETKLCKVYKDRFMLVPTCIELFPLLIPSLKKGFLPEGCGYLSDTVEDINTK